MGSDWPFLPKLTRRKDGRGRPWRENRAVLNGILWILRTGAPWADLPDRYPSCQTCHRRFQQWVRCGVLKDILSVLDRKWRCGRRRRSTSAGSA
jgi:transposase